jgi:hypothetical protein
MGIKKEVQIFADENGDKNGYATVGGFSKEILAAMNFEAFLLIKEEDYSISEAITEVFEKFQEATEDDEGVCNE